MLLPLSINRARCLRIMIHHSPPKDYCEKECETVSNFDSPKDLEYDENLTLFRYMDASNLYHLLQYNEYHLTCIKHFKDKKELPLLKEIANKINGNNQVGTNLAYDIYKMASFSSSWTQNSHETIDMWERYTKGATGIAIKTNAKKLRDALDLAPTLVGGIIYDTHIKKVNYVSKSDINYVKSLSEDEVEKIILLSHYYKTIAYKNENEVRIGYVAIDSDHLKDFINLEVGVEERYKRIEKGLKALGSDKGVYVSYNEIKYSELIEEIRISPFSYPKFKIEVKRMIDIINDYRLNKGMEKFNISVESSELS